jgi:hypothetical protein
LREGQRVEFAVEQGPKGLRAAHVKPLSASAETFAPGPEEF